MNENPGETPNPLNPTPEVGPNPEPASDLLDANPSEPMPETTVVTEITETTAAETNPQPTSAPVRTFTETVQVESLDPTGRPMQKVVPVVEAPKPEKKKTGLIVGLIIALLVLVCGGVAVAIIMMNRPKPDAVAVAMSKLMSGAVPENVAIDGNIDILLNDQNLPITRVNINLDSDIVTGSAINTSSAVLTMTTRDNNDFSVKFDEVYAANGDLYFKIDGATAALEDSKVINLITGQQVYALESDCGAEDVDCVESVTVNCEGDTSGMANCVADVETESTETVSNLYTSALMGAIEMIDGEWLKISTDELANIATSVTTNSTVSCFTDMVNVLNKNSNSTAQLYGKYPFISSTTEGVLVPSKENPVYRVSIDSANFAQFVNSVQNAGITNDLYSCLGWDGNVSASTEDVAVAVAKLPKVYVEVNGNNEFSRIYTESELGNGEISVVIDLGLSYPRNVNVSEPVEYRDFSEVIQTVMSSMFQTNSTEVVVEGETVTE